MRRLLISVAIRNIFFVTLHGYGVAHGWQHCRDAISAGFAQKPFVAARSLFEHHLLEGVVDFLSTDGLFWYLSAV